METHLTEQELAQYVDALVLDQQDQLPEEILEHVAERFECKVEIMGVWESIEASGLPPSEPLPPFDSPEKQ